MGWSDKLQQRWKVKTAFQVVVILGVFSCTGLTVVFLKRPLFSYFFEAGSMPLWASALYYVLILPVYNVLLLFYGFIFGQFRFFWDFEKRLLSRIFGSNKTTNSDHNEN